MVLLLPHDLTQPSNTAQVKINDFMIGWDAQIFHLCSRSYFPLEPADCVFPLLLSVSVRKFNSIYMCIQNNINY